MTKPGSLADKRIVITGASRGIGRAIALACARDGAVVGIGHLTGVGEARALAAEIQERYGRDSLPLCFDVTDAAAIEQALGQFSERFGEPDGWVNNAGHTRPGLLVTLEAEELRRVIEVDLVGPLLCARAVIPRMLKQRRGVLLNVSSVAAERPFRGQAPYAAAKAGVEGLTRALAIEYAKKGIRVLGLRPGAVDTAMLAATRALGEDQLLAKIPRGRVASAGEIAELAVFLLGEHADYMTGETVAIDGGYALS